MYILGISAYYHDSAAALLKDGEILAAAQEERFTRKKQDPNFPSKSIEYCLQFAGIDLNQVDYVVFYDKPFLKFERLIETYYNFSPKGLASFLKAMPVWLKEKLFLRSVLQKELEKISGEKFKSSKLLFSEHHLSHAASAFYPSPFQEAAVLTIDGVGEWATCSIFKGEGNKLKSLTETHFPHSWGLLYSAFTYYLGFRVNSGEYKLMGLAPYGNPDSQETKQFKESILNTLVSVKDDGSLWLDLDYFDFPVGTTMTKDKPWEKLFNLKRRLPEAEITQRHMNLAYAIQQVTEEGVLKMATHAKSITGSNNLCLAGGVALNCVANGKIEQSGLFENIWIQPAAGDAGGALGAALAVWHLHQESPRTPRAEDSMQGAYLGPAFSDLDIERLARGANAKYKKYEDFNELADTTAELIKNSQVIGWFQDRMEWGPRSLGNRSILGDARSPEMQKKLNLKIKYRESFRPFAPSVLEEDSKNYFDLKCTSPYMLLVTNIIKDQQKPRPEGYFELPLKEKLYFERSSIPAITHLDYTARVQTVSQKTNPKYWKLINAFKSKTGVSAIVNTSFNVRGEPIVCTPEDAYRCFMRTEMDYLVLGNYLFDKALQPNLKQEPDWTTEFPLD